MNIYDLTRPLSEHTEIYAGDPPFAVSRLMSMPRDMCNLSRLDMGLHTGTHADAPLHFIENGVAVDALPAEHFAGRAYMAHIAAERGIIKTEAIQKAMDGLAGERIFVLYTGHEGFDGIPVFEEEIGALLASNGIITLASDLPSVEPAERMHRDLLGRGIIIIEALTDLAALPAHRFFLSAAPLKIRGGDGAPLRAFAFIE